MGKKLPAEQALPPRPQRREGVPFKRFVRVELHDHATPLGIPIGPYRHIEVDMVKIVRIDGDADMAEIHADQHTALKWAADG